MKTHFLTSENEWNELVFENRNKNYGAYVLRTEYDHTVLRSYVYTLSALALLSIIFYLRARSIPAPPPVIERPYTFTDIFTIPDEVIIRPPQKKTPPPSAQHTRSFVVSDSVQSTPDHQKPTIDPASTKGTETGETRTTLPVTGGTTPSSGSGGLMEGSSEKNPALFVDIAPQFPGGEEALDRYIKGKVNFATAKQLGIEKARIVVSFIIDPEGNVTNIEAISHNGFGMEEAVETVLRKMPRWSPGKNKNTNVYVKLILPIQYELE